MTLLAVGDASLDHFNNIGIAKSGKIWKIIINY